MKVKKYLQKKSYAFIIFIMASIVCEAITFHALGFGLLPKYFLIPLTLTLIVASIIFFIPGNIVSVVLYSILTAMQCTLSITNIVLYKTLGDIFTMDLLKLTREAKEAVAGGFGISFDSIFPFVVLFALTLAIQIYFLVRIREKNKKVVHRRHGAVVLAGIAAIVGVASLIGNLVQVSGLSQDGERNIFGVSVRENFDSFKFKIPFFRAFGTYGLVYKNVILNTSPSASIISSRSNSESNEYFAEAEKQKAFNYLTGESVDPDGHGQAAVAPDAGNNVIVILLESFEDFMISPGYTPAIYGLQQKSLNFENFYGYHKTDVSEASVIFGSYPLGTTIVPSWEDVNGRHLGNTMNPSITTNFSFSLPNVLAKNGYTQNNYFHNSSGSHYSRAYTHTTYGFDNAYFLEDFQIGPEYDETTKWRNDWAWHVPEVDFFEAELAEGEGERAIDLILPDQEEPFFSFLTTINAHGAYIWRDNLPKVYQDKYDYITKNESKDFADLKARLSAAQFLNFKIALMRAMVADDGIAYLLDELEERGLAENTTILAFADHNAYGNDLSYNVKQAKRDTSPAYKIPAFLYSPALAKSLDSETRTISKFMMHFDLVPTLFDILGIEYNSRMYLGFHAFDERENIVISKLGLIFNDKFMTDGMDISWSNKNFSKEDVAVFREKYLNLVDRWSYVNNLYSSSFQFQSDLGGGSENW